MSELYKVNFGHTEVKMYSVFEDGKRVTYGYSISYDRDGKEESRTDPEVISILSYSDGSPITENHIKNGRWVGESAQGFIGRMRDKIKAAYAS